VAISPAVPVSADPADVVDRAAHSVAPVVVVEADEPEPAAVAVDAAGQAAVAVLRTPATRIDAALSTDSSRTSATAGDLNNRP
jgi:hypothetical protein